MLRFPVKTSQVTSIKGELTNKNSLYLSYKTSASFAKKILLLIRSITDVVKYKASTLFSQFLKTANKSL